MRMTKPTSPLPVGYRPTGSVPRSVKDGDSWMTIAAECGVPPSWLIQYNFETLIPAEVNWYLSTTVGCTRKTLNGKNFMFSSTTPPCVIYVPTPAVVGALTSRRYNPFGISIEGDEEYRKQVETTLDYLARSDAGMLLLKAIQRTGKPVTISAWTGSDCNATASAVRYEDANPSGEVLLQGGGSFTQMMEPSLLRDLLGLPHEPRIGTGRGSPSNVHFSPRMFGFGATGACAPSAGLPGASPSQVLFHELAHSYRQAAGKLHLRPTVGSSAVYTDKEEFFAVVLSNVLTSDPTYSTGNRTLRADHTGFGALAANLCTSRGFLSHLPNRNLIRELTADDPTLTTALKSVNSSFNPFAESL